MLINADISTNKTDFLAEQYAKLLNNGIPSCEILVLVLNSNLKNEFIKKVLPQLKIKSFEKLQVQSFNSLIYNTISDNWARIEQSIPFDNTVVIPNLAGLEISQFILKELINEIKFKGYNSKKSLLHQMFRRYSLIVQNNLSDEEVDERSKILKESFGDDAKITLKKFLTRTMQLRDFDYLRQTLAYKFIYKNTDYFKNIKYLIVDDGDEITPACFDFIKNIATQLKDEYIAYDKLGASRAGYLSADRMAVWEFEQIFSTNNFKTIGSDIKHTNSQLIFENVTNNKKNILNNFQIFSPSKRAIMVDFVIKKINKLLNQHILPSQISIITPVIDDMLKFTLQENLGQKTNLVFLAGNEKLIQNKLVLATLTMLKLNTDLKQNLSEFEIRNILNDFLGIPLKYCGKILQDFDKSKEFSPQDFPLKEYKDTYEKFLNLLNTLKESNEKLSNQVIKIFNTLSNINNTNPKDLIKFNFFIKQLQEFETVFKDEFDIKKEEIITQIENSIIAENPNSTIETTENDLIIGTPQKIIDNKIKVDYEFWLDVSSDEWIKSDTGPLYNAWVFQKGWEKDEFTIEDSVELSKEKTAKILRKLTLLADKNIFAYSSLFDGNGVENFGGIEEYIIIPQTNTEEEVPQETAAPIIPRQDQAPVLKYKNGKLAISAVPGAGKTTILLALILKLLDDGINPENIFVMTYMESAARNFRERIKNLRTNSTQLPNISTIHGLAFRILKENGNFERLNLNSDFDICDDTQKSRILKTVATTLKLKPKEIEEFERGISIYKISNGDFSKIKNDKKLTDFQKFFETYQSVLKENNLIDYDDMLISSVKLLKENPDILNYYQNLCQYIIEDEAQDSSSIQQELINLLSGENKNLIRCGDINQAITTTFSNADVKGFRQFIEENPKVLMNSSQRCAKEIYELANLLVKWADTRPQYKDAFYDIFMKPVTGKNPDIKNSIISNIFKTSTEEKNYIIKEIKKILKSDKTATIGILLRANYQVSNWQKFINDSGFTCITRNECLEQKTIFKTIFAVLKLIQKPFDNENVATQYEILSDAGFYNARLASEIRKYENPFVQINADNIENPNLVQFYWDLNYWISFSYLSVAELVIKIGLNYFTSDIEKSNVYLISTLVKRLLYNRNDFNYAIERLSELAKMSNLNGFKFFSEEDESDRTFVQGKIQIMTLHKSKGDEFDYVFIPELSERNLTIDFDSIKPKNSDFSESIKRLNPNYKPKSEIDIKIEQAQETLRLLYVGITRARKELYLSSSTKAKTYGNKMRDEKISFIFDELLGERTVHHE